MKYLYLLINAASFIIPFLFSFHPRIKFYKEFKYFIPALFISAFIFLAWDYWFTKNAIWGFNPDYITGVYIYNLPLEEVLFFICIPYACVFTYHCLNLFWKIDWEPKSENKLVLSFSFFLFLAGFYFINKAYTSITFITTSVMLWLLKYYFKVDWLPKLFSIFPILLIPFFIVNGVLTGSGLQHPVVWYNNSENLEIRIVTIPVEDTIYALELILLNLFFYHSLKSFFTGRPISTL